MSNTLLCIGCIAVNTESNAPIYIRYQNGELFPGERTKAIHYVRSVFLQETLAMFPIEDGFTYWSASSGELGIVAATMYQGDALCRHHVVMRMQKDGVIR